MAFSLRRYDTQARLSAVLSVVSIVSCAALAIGVFRHFDTKQQTVTYGDFRRMLVLLTGAVTVLLSVAGLGLGMNSAGQRRNDKPRLSWIGLFVGAAVLCVALILLFFFQTRGERAIG